MVNGEISKCLILLILLQSFEVGNGCEEAMDEKEYGGFKVGGKIRVTSIDIVSSRGCF
jgi:hypothetical protein